MSLSLELKVFQRFLYRLDLKCRECLDIRVDSTKFYSRSGFEGANEGGLNDDMNTCLAMKADHVVDYESSTLSQLATAIWNGKSEGDYNIRSH